MLRAARTDAPLVEADILRLPVRDGGADGATCGFALRNVVSLTDLFAELARVVRAGGRIALLETAEPDGRLLRLGHRAYFHGVVPAIGFVPMALATGRGAEVQKPLAVVVIAGLIVATLLTLFVLPAISRVLLHRARQRHIPGEYQGEDLLGREPIPAK